MTALALAVIGAIIQSGRAADLAEHPSARIAPPPAVAPGPPPALAFRLLQANLRHRFSNSDLVLDDAGH